jgi:UDP-N-acetylglucosamine--N-acetylmuramyl-(pentapeptide) pyrophosphoryl-undecaprenol N-acetylglucosamine transferase
LSVSGIAYRDGTMPQQCFIFAGGGTGGHIYPALAIAERLQERAGPLAECLFVVSNRPLDTQILAAEGKPAVISPAQPLGLHPTRLTRFLINYPKARSAAKALIRQHVGQGKRVQVVAMGGFVAAPAASAGYDLGVPVTLVNLDATPGRANRLIARHAGRIFTAAKIADGSSPTWEHVRPIVRQAALAPDDAPGCRRILGLDPQKPTLFVTGASQGASSMNRLMIELVKREPLLFEQWQVIHQTGKSDTAECRAAYEGAGVRSIVEPFIQRMGPVWGAADLALSRAGAGSVAESWGNRVPTIFMPYPYHRDQHQRKNAEFLERAGACLIQTDAIEPGLNLPTAGAALISLMNDHPRRQLMRQQLHALGPVDGAENIADALLA